jgi:hypothetical protein
MLEAAGNYIRASQILWHQPNMGKVAIVNSAIGIEIMLKSFIASPVENHRKNTVGEQYKLKKRSHRLLNLYKDVDPSIARKLRLDTHEEWFRKYDQVFEKDRYPYEANSNIGCSQTLIDIGLLMFRAMITWYKESGNQDPWVLKYPNVAGGGL